MKLGLNMCLSSPPLVLGGELHIFRGSVFPRKHSVPCPGLPPGIGNPGSPRCFAKRTRTVSFFLKMRSPPSSKRTLGPGQRDPISLGVAVGGAWGKGAGQEGQHVN